MKKFEQDNDVKYFLGLPYRWKWKEMFKNTWNSKEDRVLPPKQFGLGWNLNFYALWKKVSGGKRR